MRTKRTFWSTKLIQKQLKSSVLTQKTHVSITKKQLSADVYSENRTKPMNTPCGLCFKLLRKCDVTKGSLHYPSLPFCHGPCCQLLFLPVSLKQVLKYHSNLQLLKRSRPVFLNLSGVADPFPKIFHILISYNIHQLKYRLKIQFLWSCFLLQCGPPVEKLCPSATAHIMRKGNTPRYKPSRRFTVFRVKIIT
jgi:hypothetical protein